MHHLKRAAGRTIMEMKNILFLCTGNSCRSQMAEGWARKYWGNEFNVFSAGTKKHGMNERAVKVMREAGVDMSTHYSKTVEELPQVTFDYVVTVCGHANENCPYFPGSEIVHVGFDDPPALTKDMTNEEEILTVYRRVRDEIHESIKNLKDLLS
jgi:arsenate reductase (thioredoxin)